MREINPASLEYIPFFYDARNTIALQHSARRFMPSVSQESAAILSFEALHDMFL
jgi:hypothetical protein